MARKFKKVPQPPIDRAGRRSEARSVVIGITIAAVGIIIILGGRVRKYEITYKNGYREITNDFGLVDAIPHGGIQQALAASGQEKVPPTTTTTTTTMTTEPAALQTIPAPEIEKEPDIPCPT